MIVFGSQLFGRTYRVAGGFHVSTRFLHVMFFPIVPRSSWLVPAKERRGPLGREILYALPRIEWRSVVLAWIRAILIFAALIAALILCTQVLLDRPPEVLAQAGAVLLALGIAYWCSYRFDRPSAAALAELLASPGIPHQLATLRTRPAA